MIHETQWRFYSPLLLPTSFFTLLNNNFWSQLWMCEVWGQSTRPIAEMVYRKNKETWTKPSKNPWKTGCVLNAFKHLRSTSWNKPTLPSPSLAPHATSFKAAPPCHSFGKQPRSFAFLLWSQCVFHINHREMIISKNNRSAPVRWCDDPWEKMETTETTKSFGHLDHAAFGIQVYCPVMYAFSR